MTVGKGSMANGLVMVTQELQIVHDGWCYVISECDILKCRSGMKGFPEYHKEFSPPLDMPFGLQECAAVINQANETPGDTFVHTLAQKDTGGK